MNDIFIARQPIYERDLSVYGYELLFRAADTEHAHVVDGNQATSQVILNAFTVMGLDELVGGHLAFINLTQEFLLKEERVPFPVDRVVLEVLEGVEPTEQLIAVLRDFKAAGYRISLDDFVYSEALLPLVRLADIVKVETSVLNAEQLREHVRLLRPYGVKLLAEKVETRQEFELCLELGFDYFQGYFLSRPRTLRGSSIPTHRLPTLTLLAALYRPDVDMEELEDLISQDVSLSYKLLRYLNSAFFPVQRKIDSIRQAVVYLGLQDLRTWASLLALASGSDKPQELMITVMVRAKMCQLLAEALDLKSPSAYFTVGLFSGLDALLDAPLEEIVHTLPLTPETEAALLRKEGPAGRVLDCALSYECGDWDHILGLGVDPEKVITAYLEAIAWTDRIGGKAW